VISHRTGVPIDALGAGKGFVGATVYALACILGAGVVIVTQLDEFALDQGRFIDVTVAVFIYSITAFRLRFLCVAV